MNDKEQLERVVRFYERLELSTVRDVRAVYTPDAYFKDPFNEVGGHDAIIRIFEHMFTQVDQPSFVVHTSMAQGGQGFLVWEFRYHMKRLAKGPQIIRGSSHLVFDGEGRVCMHRDYWDAAEELYEKIPLLGGFMRLLKRRANS